MTFNINELKATLSADGYQKSSGFAASIILPPILGTKPIMDSVPLRINSTNLPGFQLQTDDFRQKGYGLTEKRPIQINFDDITMTIISDGKGLIHDALHSWQELVFPTDDSNGSEDVEYFEYPNTYYGGLEVYMYDIAAKKHTTYTFRSPYPINVGGIQMSWENANAIEVIAVTFAHRGYKTNSSHSGAITTTSGVTPASVEAIVTA